MLRERGVEMDADPLRRRSTSEATAVAGGEYVTFAVTAKTGYAVSFSAVSQFDYRRSATGPAFGELQVQVGTGAFTDVASLELHRIHVWRRVAHSDQPVRRTGTPKCAWGNERHVPHRQLGGHEYLGDLVHLRYWRLVGGERPRDPGTVVPMPTAATVGVETAEMKRGRL